MSREARGFKRINFFKGFLTTESDWNAAEKYHIEKRQLHNKVEDVVKKNPKVVVA